MATKTAKKATKKRTAAKKTKPTSNGQLGDVAQAFVSKHLRPTGTKGQWTFTGNEDPVRGEAKAVEALVAAAAEQPSLAKVVHRAQLAQQVHDLTEEGLTVGEVAEKLGITSTTANSFQLYAAAPAIRWESKEELGDIAAKMRDEEELAWVEIATRAGVSQALIKKLYGEATGRDASESRLEGKGGRPAAPKTKGKATKTKPAPKKTATKKTAPKGKGKAKTAAPKPTAKAKKRTPKKRPTKS